MIYITELFFMYCYVFIVPYQLQLKPVLHISISLISLNMDNIRAPQNVKSEAKSCDLPTGSWLQY